MPNHLSQRITFLRALAEQGLFEANLDKLTSECSHLSQDGPHVLVFYILRHVFEDIARALDGFPVEAGRYEELNTIVGTEVRSVLLELERGGNVGTAELERLVRASMLGLSLFNDR